MKSDITSFLDNYIEDLMSDFKNTESKKVKVEAKTYSVRKDNSARTLNEGFSRYLNELMDNSDEETEEDFEEITEAKSDSLDISDSKSSTSKVLKDTMNDWATMTRVSDIVTFIQKKFNEANLDTDGSRKIIERVRRAKSVNSAIEILTNSMMSGMGLGMNRGSGKRESYEMNENRYDKYLDQKRAEELGLSPEELAAMDKEDSDLIRSAYSKIQARGNARLDPKEKAVLAKYGLERDSSGHTIRTTTDDGQIDWSKDGDLRQTGRHPASKDASPSFYRKWDGFDSIPDRSRVRHEHDNQAQGLGDKVNIADAARKAARRNARTFEREKAGWQNEYANPDTTDDHDRRHSSGYRSNPSSELDLDRDYVNNLSYKRVSAMKGALSDLKTKQAQAARAQDKFDKRKAEYDAAYMKKMQDAERDYDMYMRWAQSDLDSESDPKRVRDAQSKVNRMLGKPEETEND